jgi:hypothetical protein
LLLKCTSKDNGGYFQKLSWGSKTLDMTSEGLEEILKEQAKTF